MELPLKAAPFSSLSVFRPLIPNQPIPHPITIQNMRFTRYNFLWDNLLSVRIGAQLNGSVHCHIPWPVPPSGCPREPQATVGAGHRKCRTGLLLVVTKVRVHLIFEALTYIVLRTLRTQSPYLRWFCLHVPCKGLF